MYLRKFCQNLGFVAFVEAEIYKFQVGENKSTCFSRSKCLNRTMLLVANPCKDFEGSRGLKLCTELLET